MHRLIISFYDDFGAAHTAVKELVEKGFRQNAISLVVHQAVCDQIFLTDRANSWFFASQPAAVELVAIGPVLVSGFLACDLGSASLVNVLKNCLVPNAEAHAYAEGVRRKGILVLVRADRTNSSKALHILDRYCPVDMDCLVEQWQRSGWTGFDDKIKPLARPGFRWPNCITSQPGDALMVDGKALNWPQSIAGRMKRP